MATKCNHQENNPVVETVCRTEVECGMITRFWGLRLISVEEWKNEC